MPIVKEGKKDEYRQVMRFEDERGADIYEVEEFLVDEYLASGNFERVAE
jgi:hypothetical protein